VEEDPVYVAVKKNTSGSRPKELFEDLVVVSMCGVVACRTMVQSAHVAFLLLLLLLNWVRATPDRPFMSCNSSSQTRLIWQCCICQTVLGIADGKSPGFRAHRQPHAGG
jgi:hypothetical protein